MPGTQSLTTSQVHSLFTEEIAAAGGAVTDTFDDGSRLFTRSVLPETREVRPKDRLQGGVALKAAGNEAGTEVWVHPYVFRLVCKNGAIMAHATQARHLPELDRLSPEAAGLLIRDAVRACCAPEAFAVSTREMRATLDQEASMAITQLASLSRLPEELRGRMLEEVMRRLFKGGDLTAFGLMNAVTSLARDTQDPDTRWRLEELGGGLAVARWSPPPVRTAPAAEALPFARAGNARELELVG